MLIICVLVVLYCAKKSHLGCTWVETHLTSVIIMVMFVLLLMTSVGLDVVLHPFDDFSRP